MTTFFLNACLKVIEAYKHADSNVMMGWFWIRQNMDRQLGQYKCNQIFCRLPLSPGDVGAYSHRLHKNCNFKGVWDAAGKVIKELYETRNLLKVVTTRF
jgi:hypothetical protein